MSDETLNDLLTLGDLRRELPDHAEYQIKYALRTYAIEPAGRIGIVRVWHREQLPQIKSALARIAGRREVSHAR